MLDLRQRLLMIIGLGAGIIIVIILLFFFLGGEEERDPEQVATPDEGVPESTTTPDEQFVAPPAPQPSADLVLSDPSEQQIVRQTSERFVERFASYSTQNDNTHLDAVRDMVTTEMERWIETQYAEQKQVYEGVSTRVIVTRVATLDDVSATVQIQAQTQAQSDGVDAVTRRKGRVELVQQNGTWLVDGFFWED